MGLRSSTTQSHGRYTEGSLTPISNTPVPRHSAAKSRKHLTSHALVGRPVFGTSAFGTTDQLVLHDLEPHLLTAAHLAQTFQLLALRDQIEITRT